MIKIAGCPQDVFVHYVVNLMEYYEAGWSNSKKTDHYDCAHVSVRVMGIVEVIGTKLGSILKDKWIMPLLTPQGH